MMLVVKAVVKAEKCGDDSEGWDGAPGGAGHVLHPDLRYWPRITWADPLCHNLSSSTFLICAVFCVYIILHEKFGF